MHDTRDVPGETLVLSSFLLLSSTLSPSPTLPFSHSPSLPLPLSPSPPLPLPLSLSLHPCPPSPCPPQVEALEVGLGAIATIASAIEDWAERIGQPTHAPGFLPPDAGVAPYLDAFEAHPPARGRTRSRAPVLRAAHPPGLQVDGEALPNAYRKAMVGGTKEQRERACVDLQARVVEEVVGAQRREAAAAEAAAARALLEAEAAEEAAIPLIQP